MTQHAPLILDIAGTRLTPADRRRLAHPLTGGMILFARNWESRAQLSALCADIKRVRRDLLICVDHEGWPRAALSRPMVSPTCRPCRCLRRDVDGGSARVHPAAVP
jgi:beta-glucosidase-like glycosyl hydrolase